MKNTARFLLLSGFIGICTSGSGLAVQLYQAFGGNQGIWWTATTMPLMIDETEDSFELFIDGKRLQDHLAEGTLAVQRDRGDPARIATSDISVRLNNWSKVRASFLMHALLPAALCSASLTLLIIGLVQILSRDKNVQATALPR